jgi:hypothetical protein
VTHGPLTERTPAVRDHSASLTDNHTLSPKRRKTFVENAKFDAFARRIVRAFGRRVATGDVEALASLVALSTALDKSIQDAVDGLRACGYSWTEIGDRLGISRQAARQKWMAAPADTNACSEASVG